MPRKLDRRELITYAFLSQGIYGSEDRLAGLLPFFQPIVERHVGDIFDPVSFAQEVNALYPWSINSDIAENLVPRLQAAGWLRQLASHDGEAVFQYVDPIRSAEDSGHLSTIEGTLNQIGNAFLAFIREISPLTAVGYNNKQLEELLLRWIVEKRAFDRTLLLSAVKGEGPAHVLARDSLSDDDLADNDVFPAEENYLCGRFVEYLSKEDNALFDHVASIAAVTMVTEVVLDTAAPGRQTLTFDGGPIFYDAPFLLDCLGCTGEERLKNASFIHTHLLGFEARPACFGHSVQEAVEILRAVLRAAPPNRRGPTAEAMRKGDLLEEYVRDVANRIDDHVQRLNVQKIDIDLDAFPNDHRFFNRETINEFISRIRWDRLLARERDAWSIAYVMRRRRGRQTTDIARALPILLTRNAALSDSAFRFCRDRNLLEERHIGPAIHQRQMASLIWMVVGSAERKELARRDLMQRCADVVRCRPEVVERTREQLRRIDLHKSRQFEALISRPRSVQLLMDLTLGAERVVTSENLDAIFERLRVSAADDVQRRAKKERDRLKQRHKAQQDALSQELEAEREKRREIEAEKGTHLMELSSNLDRINAEFHEQKERRRREELALLKAWLEAGEKRGSRISFIIHATLYVFLGFSALAAAGLIWTDAAYWSALATSLMSVGSAAIAISEKFGLIPRIGDRFIFRQKVKLVNERAREAGREELLQELECDYEEKVLRIRSMRPSHVKEHDNRGMAVAGELPHADNGAEAAPSRAVASASRR